MSTMAEAIAPQCPPQAAIGRDVLRWYSQCYERLRSLCTAQRMQAETLLRCVEAATLYASAHHPGRVADGAIENLALEIGKTLDQLPTPGASPHLHDRSKRARCGKRRILHVSPSVWRVGGHTRTIRNWIRTDHESQHSLVLTQSVDSTLLSPMEEEVRHTGGDLLVLSGQTMGLLARAKALRVLAQSSADLVILHHSCNDVIPSVAFAIKDDLPPVAFVNDCDQAFWLGSSIADLIVNQREAGARLSAERRFTRCNAVLPIPLSAVPNMSRDDARQTLGIDSDQLMILTVGRAIKYRPAQSHNFLRTVRKVLDHARRAHLYVVGLSEEEAIRWQLDWRHPRIHLCGANPDPSTHRAAADIYLESMPFGSATALLEAAHAGVAVVLPFAQSFDLFVTNHGLEHIVSNARTEEEYLDRVHRLLNNVEERHTLAEGLRDHVRSQHTGVGWRTQVTNLYGMAERLEHHPQPIPVTECTVSALDIALSEWQAFLNGDVDSTARDTKTLRELVLNAAYLARECGDYRGSFELLWKSLETFGFDRRMLAAAAKLPAHKLYRGSIHRHVPQSLWS